MTLPPSPDQFNHAYLGWRLLNGGVPYRAAIDMNWPGVMWLHAMATGIFGANVWSWRAFDYLAFGITCIFLCDLVSRAAGRGAAKVCAVTSPALYVTAGYWLAGQHDMSAAHLLVAALWAHVRGCEQGNWRWQLLAGSALAAAMLNKPTVGVMLPLLALHALTQGIPSLRVVRYSAAATIGMLATLAAAGLIVIVAFGTTPQELFDATIVYNITAQYVTESEIFPSRSRNLLFYFAELHALRWGDLTMAATPALIWLAKPANRSPAGTVLYMLWLTGALSYFVQARGLAYHLAPAYMALVAFVPISFHIIRSTALRSNPRWKRAALILIVSGLPIGLANRIIYSYQALPLAIWQMDLSIHYARFKENDGMSVADAMALARRVRMNPINNCLLVLGKGSAINYLSELPQPTRFYYFPMIMQAVAPMPLAQKWQELWEADIASTQCSSIFIFNTIEKHWLPKDRPASQVVRMLLLKYKRLDASRDAGELVEYKRR